MTDSTIALPVPTSNAQCAWVQTWPLQGDSGHLADSANKIVAEPDVIVRWRAGKRANIGDREDLMRGSAERCAGPFERIRNLPTGWIDQTERMVRAGESGIAREGTGGRRGGTAPPQEDKASYRANYDHQQR